MWWQSGQQLFNLSSDLWVGCTRLAVGLRWVQAPCQFHEPAAVAFELPIGGGKRRATLPHGHQPLQYWRVPFLRVRGSEAAKRAQSSNTRRPPRATGGVLPAVSVARIKSA